MPVLIKQLPVIIVSRAVITKESAVTCIDVLLEMFLPNSNEIAQQSIATEYRDSPGAQRRVIHLCPGCPQMLVWSLRAAAAGEADPPYCSYSLFSACHRKTGIEDCADASAHGKSCIPASSARGLEPLFLLHPLFPLETFLPHLGKQWGLWFHSERIHFQRKKNMFGSNQEDQIKEFIRDEINKAINLGLTYNTLFANKTSSLSWGESPCFIFGL